MVKLALLCAALATGCLRNAAFPCSQDVDCARGGEQGVCEATGFCSFVDPACDGGRRYGELSGSLSNQCVGGGTPIDGPPGDVPVTTDGPPTDGPPVVPFCDATDPTLAACWEFEGNLNDASGNNNNGTGTNVTFVAGQTGMGAMLASNSHIAIADTASMSPPTLTFEGWINPSELPGSGLRMGVIDNDGSYGMFLQNGGVFCTMSAALQVTVPIALNVFTHVACTYDGTTVTMFVNGAQVGTLGGGVALGAGGTNGSALGGNSPTGDTLVGIIDQFRVWNVARSADDICRAAGRTPPCT
jgi:hypothetical protein